MWELASGGLLAAKTYAKFVLCRSSATGPAGMPQLTTFPVHSPCTVGWRGEPVLKPPLMHLASSSRCLWCIVFPNPSVGRYVLVRRSGLGLSVRLSHASTVPKRLNWPINIPNHSNFGLFISPFVSSWYVAIETSNLIDGLIVASASPWMTNCPWMELDHWSGHVNYLNLVGINHISGTAEARAVKFWKQVGI